MKGYFTAPSDGLYFFSVSGSAYTGKFANFGIFTGLNTKCNGWADGRDSKHGFGTGGCSTVLSLKAGDKVGCYNASDEEGTVYFAHCTGVQI